MAEEGMKLNKLIIKAALLHDIGKVCFRAGEGLKEHSLLGVEYLGQFINVDDNKQLLNCVRYHHKSNLKGAKLAVDDISYIVYEADNIAAGSDRRKNESAVSGFDRYAPLQSIFNLVGEVSQVTSSFSLCSLNPKDKINYPKIEQASATQAQYAALLHVLRINFQNQALEKMENNELLKILEGTMSYIPSSTAKDEVCDVSLYDHQKITAALSVAMLEYFRENNISDYREYCFGSKNEEFRTKDVFLLISGDLSGIQDFIYTIPSAGALKSLRGRSFYLDLLLENIVDEILTALELSRANLLYTGGGHFYLLAANTKKTTELLENAKKSISHWFLKEHGAQLYLALVWEVCSACNFMQTAAGKDNTGDIFAKLSKKLNLEKISRYDQEQLEVLFDPNSIVNKNVDGSRECSVCHSSTRELRPYCLKSDILVCSTCNNLALMGKRILEEDIVLFVGTTLKQNGFSVPGIGRDLYVWAVDKNKMDKCACEEYPVRIYVKNEFMAGNALATNLWAGDYAAKDQFSKVLDFADLAKLGCGNGNLGIKRLGVLRADVDNLGATFVAGFYKKGIEDHNRYATLSRYTMLSRQLSIFFKHCVNKICCGDVVELNGNKSTQFHLFADEASSKSAKNVQIVYSGGDDVFVVGAWSDIIEVAVDINRAFKIYTCGKLTFSAGVGFYKEGFPVSQMALLTGNLEENAKSVPGKDSISLFGTSGTVYSEQKRTLHLHTYKWDVFIDSVWQGKLAFLESHWNLNNRVYHEDKMSVGKGAIYCLMDILQPAENSQEFNLARLAYVIARMEPYNKKNKSLMECFVQWRNQVYLWSKNPEDRRELVTALNLLVYKMRDTVKENRNGYYS